LWYVTPVDWRDPTQEIAPIFQEATSISALMTLDSNYNASTAIAATNEAYWASRPTWTATSVPGRMYRVVAIQGVNVRSMATTSAGVVGRLNYGLDVWITNVSAGLVDGWRWGYVNTPGAMGWVALYNASVTLLQAK
jgi:hypothetical protein